MGRGHRVAKKGEKRKNHLLLGVRNVKRKPTITITSPNITVKSILIIEEGGREERQRKDEGADPLRGGMEISERSEPLFNEYFEKSTKNYPNTSTCIPLVPGGV